MVSFFSLKKQIWKERIANLKDGSFLQFLLNLACQGRLMEEIWPDNELRGDLRGFYFFKVSPN